MTPLTRLIRYTLILSSLLFSHLAFGQNLLQRKIIWQNDLKSEQAIYPASVSGLPVFSGKSAWTGGSGARPEVTLTNVSVEPVVMIDSVVRKIMAQNPGNSFRVVSSIQYERKVPFVVYSIFPYRKNSSTGVLEKLVQYAPEINMIAETVPMAAAQKSTRNYTTRSLLADGKWYKIQISQTGIQKLTFADLKKIGLQNPENVRVYGNTGKQLPYLSNLERQDDLVENQVYLEKGSDGVFNEGDYILFYGVGPVTWKYDPSTKLFSHRLHLYSDYAYYFLTEDLGPGRRVTGLSPSTLTSQVTVTTYNSYDYREKDSLNLIKSGRLWCWKHFSIELLWGFDFNFPNRVATAPVQVTASLWARSPSTGANSKFYIQNGDTRITTVSLTGVPTNNYEALYASSAVSNSKFTPDGESFRINFQFAPSTPSSEGWLDYVILNTRSNLVFNGTQLAFRDAVESGTGKVVKFRIENASTGNLVWDVTDFRDIRQQSIAASGTAVEFTAAADQIREYIIFAPGSAGLNVPVYAGEGLGLVPNQNLHGSDIPDMVILVHDDLKTYAQELAVLHKEKDGLSSLIVTPVQVYNEFSSGATDVTAIRDFLKMLYDRSGSGSTRLKYFLFFGDGSYDNKNIVKSFRTCLPTYQSLESLYPTSSYVTDDFFGLLDNGEDLEPGLLDIGIGRFPVISENEASVVVDKVKQYYSASSLGDWRNLICFIGDDEDGNTHMRDANTLADLLTVKYPEFNVEKIFLDAYQQVSMPAGERYPEVNRAIGDRMKKGALIMNYIGHGSEKGLAHEEILTISDIKNWDNPGRFPLFMTATCEFSRFDDTTTISAGEWVLLNPTGGGIGLFSTTRLVYSSPNFILNREFYNYAFERDQQGNPYRFGDIMRLTKNGIGEEQNKLNFTLLGDPALALSYPSMNIFMDLINGKPVAEFNDTLKALTRTVVTGHVTDLSGNKLTGFNGIVIPTVYDKEITLNNLANDGGPVMDFNVRNSILFRGKASVTNGDFTFSFLVPKDIGYQIGTGKFSFYGKSDLQDAHGVEQRVRIGGSEGASLQDQVGPEINVFLNDTSFVDGGISGENPVLLVRVNDDSGINTTGNGIGHDITAVLDGNQQNVLVLNDYYESDLDEYRSGSIRYPLSKLTPGQHSLKVKVWDVLNNSNESELTFTVRNSDEIVLDHVLNYPNPFTTKTDFYFEHNQGDQALDVLIQIFTVSGKLVKSFEFLSADQTEVKAGSYRVGPVSWDGLDDFGDPIGRGTYFYRVRVRTPDGKTKDAFQKLVILK